MFDTHWQLSAILGLYKFMQCHSSEGCLVSSKKTCNKQVPLKSYSLKIRTDSVNQILKNKEKVT